MSTFLNMIHCGAEPHLWHEDANSCFEALPLIDKGRFLVRQSLGINYLNLVYHNTLPLLIKQYNNEITNKLIALENKFSLITDTDSYNAIVISKAIEICHFLLDPKSYPGLVSIDDITFFMTDDEIEIPAMGTPSFYIPYIHFCVTTSNYRNTRLSEDNNYHEHHDMQYSKASILLLNWHGKHLSFSVASFPSYNFDHITFNKEYDKKPYHTSFLAYLGCMDLTGYKFKSVLGMIASFAIEFDDNVITTAYERFLKHIALTLFSSTPNTSVKRTYIPEQLVNQVIHFICYIRECYSIEIDDKILLTKLFFNIVNGNTYEQLEKYFTIDNAQETSVELYTAFKTSRFGKFDELDIMIPSTEELDPDEEEPTEDPEPEESTEGGLMIDKDPPSLDKLMFRDTVRKHINNIIANPEDVSSETLTVLKNLKIYWLNLLSKKSIELILVMTNSPVNS